MTITPERIAELRKRAARSYYMNEGSKDLLRMLLAEPDEEDNRKLLVKMLDEIERLRAENAQLARLRERLERLRPLSEAATDAPWKQNRTGTGQCADPMAHVYQSDDGYETVALTVEVRDAAFIAAARNEIAAMLEELKP